MILIRQFKNDMKKKTAFQIIGLMSILYYLNKKDKDF